MNNIADDPEYDPIRKELSTALMQILREQSDPGSNFIDKDRQLCLVESPCRFEHAPYAGTSRRKLVKKNGFSIEKPFFRIL